MSLDLTYPIHPGMYKYPSDPEVEADQTRALRPDGEKAVSGHLTCRFRNHHGTHLDAPAHKIPGGKTIDQYEAQRFSVRAAVIDVSHVCRRENRGINREDLTASDFHRATAADISALVIYTGFGDELTDRRRDRETPTDKLTFERTFPYFEEDAARQVVELIPGLTLIGIDSFSFDPSGSNSEAHRIFFARDILLLETLVNLKMLLKKVGFSPFNLTCEIPRCFERLYRGADAAQVIVSAER